MRRSEETHREFQVKVRAEGRALFTDYLSLILIYSLTSELRTPAECLFVALADSAPSDMAMNWWGRQF